MKFTTSLLFIWQLQLVMYELVAGDGSSHAVWLIDWSSWHKLEHADERQASIKLS